jgi:osmotically-inducible protein OsmY
MSIKKHNRGQRLSSLLLGAIVVLAIFSSPLQAKKIEDKDITLAVERKLFIDPSVPSHYIDVKTDEGIVTLLGSVDNILAKDRATEIAETIKGVRSVVNIVTVKPSFRTDKEIRKDVQWALLSDPATDSYEIKAEVKKAVATLTGTVESWQEKQLCGQIAKTVKGVKDVENQITVVYKAERLDIEIKPEIERVLESDVWVDDVLIDVEVQDGKVTLSGTVGSAAEKSRAFEDAWVAGVKSVDTSNLGVKWWLRDKMRRERKYTESPDEEIEQAVKDALSTDPRVMAFNPIVDADNGVVSLTGIVDNLKAKRAAEEDAKNTLGVWRVKNYLKVRPETLRNDTQLTKDVKMALSLDPVVEKYQVNVSVANGKVRLSGWVDSYYEQIQAESVASRVKGVVEVDNNLQVASRWRSKTEKSDWEIRQDIKDELWWNPYVDSDEVTVTVRDGIATLTGTVDSWREWWTASENAYDGGALRVRNYLKVRDNPGFLG